MAGIGIDNLKANLSNIARTYMWDVLIPVPIGDGDSETYNVRAQSSQIPGKSFGEMHVDYKQTAGIELAGRLRYDHTWECTFIEGEDKKVFDAIYSWQQNIVHDITGVGVGDPLYKTDAYLTLLTTANAIFMKIKLKGAFISKVGDVALTYDNDGTVKYAVTFKFDSWEEIS